MALLALLIALAAPPAPTVTGPRETESTRPAYTFRARGALSYRCAFDTTRLHRCAARYVQTLTVGAHVLRVRAVGRRGGALSRTTTVRVVVLAPVPALKVGTFVPVGPGAGVPAPLAASVWVPTTGDGMLARVVSGAVAGRTPVGTAGASGDLDSAIATTRRFVVTASDSGARISLVDPATAAVTRSFAVAARPGGLVEGNSGLIYAFHFLQGTITAVDPAAGTMTQLQGPNARATGIAFSFVGAGSLWLLSTGPAQLLELDPGTASVRRTIALQPPFAPRRAFIQTWSLVATEGGLWATLPSHDALAHVDAATGAVQYVRLRWGRPFGVSVGAGSVWAVTDHALVRLDEKTGEILGVATLPAADRSGFMSVTYGYGAGWVTNYDRGTLVDVTP